MMRAQRTQPAARVRPALEALAAGRSIVLIDEARARGYFVCAADRGAEELVAFAAEHGQGVLKAAMPQERLDALGIPALSGTDCHAPVDLRGFDRPGVAADRMATLRALADPATDPGEFVAPGHVFPTAAGDCDSIDDACVARVMVEAVRLAGCEPAAAFSEAADEALAGWPPSTSSLAALARRLGIVAVSVRDLLVHREALEPAVERVVETRLPTTYGALTAVGYVGGRFGQEYVAFVAGTGAPVVRVHVHRRCQVSDVFGGARCGCGEQLREALQEIQGAGAGAVVYYGPFTSCFCATATDPDARERASWTLTAEVAAVLHDLGMPSVVVSSNGPLSLEDLGALGIDATPRRSDGAAAAAAAAAASRRTPPRRPAALRR
jgi:3,4-dihydroxy 2-butanone 4-phosphate synthase/GTP cyclohydrolase II